MTSTALFFWSFTGAVLGDFLALAASLKSGQLPPTRWRSPSTYIGLLLYGSLAGALALALDAQISSRPAALAVGLNLPLIVQKLALLTPRLDPPRLLQEPGISPSREFQKPAALESARRFLAKTS
jgi:hypothetical protein